LHQQSKGSVLRPQSKALPQRGQRACRTAWTGEAEAVMAARSQETGFGDVEMMPQPGGRLDASSKNLCRGNFTEFAAQSPQKRLNRAASAPVASLRRRVSHLAKTLLQRASPVQFGQIRPRFR
jgi:hypothetical protein